MADVVTKIPDANWVRLEIEPVQVSHDGDATLNFATVQSVVPGAHGLYYRDGGERKALLFDNNTGKVYPPPNGWESVPIFIHLAHGSRHGTHFADYSKANDAFEKNISAVQKLFAAAGLGGRSNKVYAAGKTRARSTSKKNTPRSQFDAQPENVNISEESEGRDSEKEKVDRQIEKLKNRNDELKIKAKEYKSDLSVAQLKIKNLEKKLESVKSSGYFEESGDKFVRIDSELDEKRSLDQDEEINNLHSVIEELRNKLAIFEADKKDLESKYSESQDYLKNAKDKVAYLENQLSLEAQEEVKSTAVRALEVKLNLANNSIRQIEADKQQLQEANWYANERLSKLEQENGYLKGVTEQLKARADNSHSEKLLKESEKRVWEINDEKAKLEWRLGELSQWWNDSKWKIGELESSVAQQRNLLDTANAKIQCLNDQGNSSTMTIPSDGFTISQSRQGTWQLANGSAQPCFTGSIPSVPLLQTYPAFAAASPFVFGPNEGRNVTLTIADNEHDVYLTGSFINWKCTLKCEKLVSGKKGVTVNLTRGRHEFRFMINGEWATSHDYQQVPNGLGGQNNIVFVE
uniref:AMP-activated protein kinase glycogen-binding domain-containing protein n=1 Tax=Caenorhabditis japonica TaxID=281687 RepID=A0A8R1EN15_CAEJA